MIEVTHNGIWDAVLRVLRDPIFALLFAVFLAFLSSRPIRGVVRFICFLAAVVILIWLAAHNASSAHVEIAVIAAMTRVMLTFIVVLLIIAIIAIAAVLIMYIKTQPSASPRSGRRSSLRVRSSFMEGDFRSVMASMLEESSLGNTADDDVAKGIILEESVHLGDNLEAVACLIGELLDDLDDVDNPAQMCIELMRIYFSGLSAHATEIRVAHEECGRSIGRISTALERASVKVHPQLRDMSRKNWLPTSSQWAAVMQDSDAFLPYLALRIICIRAVWRSAAMVIYKPIACAMLLAHTDDPVAR